MITTDPIRQQRTKPLPWKLLAALIICLGATITSQRSLELVTTTYLRNNSYYNDHNYTEDNTPKTRTTNEPNLGTLYDCGITKLDGAYALPDPLNCINQNEIGAAASFEGEILKYEPIITRIPIYHCTLTMISYICRENALWIADLDDKQTPLKISAKECLLSAQLDTYDGAKLLYSKDGKTRYSPQRKRRHCHYNSYTQYDDKILQIYEYEGI